MTVTQLKEIIANWPEIDGEGEPTEVWIMTGKELSSPVIKVTRLSQRMNSEREWADMLLESALYD